MPRKARPDAAERRRAYQAEWARARRLQRTELERERDAARWRAYHAEHGERLAERKRERRAADPELHRALSRAASAKSRRERKANIDAIKLASGCADCGYNQHAVALDFDHIDPADKIASVSFLVDRYAPWEIVMAEIAKCEVVCSNCHRVRTHVGATERTLTVRCETMPA